MTVHLLQHVQNKAMLIVAMANVVIPHGGVMVDIQTVQTVLMKLIVLQAVQMVNLTV
jgi:hypothetical protein